ncbi:putative monoamine oxidase n [Diaporthe ampelina]|uniref:Putative monoamine oxidase n n=1 Tax=Diaporthe ampelina TaxID=1214573 RepID=A0A0G2IG23_9PEZI|nr:putative monoamine oxidase n [Diaporthe ampelina]
MDRCHVFHNKLSYAIGDGTPPAGNMHIVAFGREFNHMDPEKSVEETLGAVKGLSTPENYNGKSPDIERLVFHN